MVIKLGDLLVQEGLITSAELEEALKYQVIFGGKLGTNLIEMGLIEEGVVARVLSKKLGVPFVNPPDHLMNIPPEVIKLIPAEIAEKYGVVPLGLDKRRLTLVMADPSDLKAIDEIAFRTGYIVRPVVTPEVRLVQALAKHYEIDRGLRYIQTERKVAQKAPQEDSPAAPSVAPQPKSPANDAAEQPQKPAAPAAAPPPLPVTEVPDYFELETNQADSKAEQERPAAPSPAPPPVTLDGISARLAEARDREDIADSLIAYLGQTFNRGILFLLRDETATGWRGVAGGKPVADIDQLRIPLREPSVLKMVTMNKSYYLGPLPATPFNQQIAQGLRGSAPETALLVPLLMMGRVVGVIYVDENNAPLADKVIDLQKIATKAAMAFEILLLKNKILMM